MRYTLKVKNKIEDFKLIIENPKEKLSTNELNKLKKYIKESYNELYVKNEELDIKKM